MAPTRWTLALLAVASPVGCAPASPAPGTPQGSAIAPSPDAAPPVAPVTAPPASGSGAAPALAAADDAGAWTDRYTGQIDLGAVAHEHHRIDRVVRETCPVPARPGRSSVYVEFAPSDGHVQKAWFEYSPYPDTPTGDCVLRAVATARVPPFRGPPFRMGLDIVVGADPGGNATFGNFDHRAAAAAMDSAVASARACLAPGAKPVHVKVVVERSGDAKDVAVEPSAPNAECVRGAFNGLRVPPYVGLDVTLDRDVAPLARKR